jgi:hypothetical protein
MRAAPRGLHVPRLKHALAARSSGWAAFREGRLVLNRTENLPPFPQSSEDKGRLHALRPDAESINDGIERSLYIKRASAGGWRRQIVNLLGHASLVNAITLARCRARELVTTPA